jgi:hypothetical protein
MDGLSLMISPGSDEEKDYISSLLKKYDKKNDNNSK